MVHLYFLLILFVHCLNFILGHNQGFFPRVTVIQPTRSVEDLETMAEVRRTMIDKFWKVWSLEYIRNLPPISGPKGSTKLAVGSLVLVRDHLTPRLKWPIGKISKVFRARRME